MRFHSYKCKRSRLSDKSASIRFKGLGFIILWTQHTLKIKTEKEYTTLKTLLKVSRYVLDSDLICLAYFMLNAHIRGNYSLKLLVGQIKGSGD